MRCENIKHAFTIANAAAGGDLDAENCLLACVMLGGILIEDAFFIRPADRPAGKASSDFLHVLLRVAAVDTKRM